MDHDITTQSKQKKKRRYFLIQKKKKKRFAKTCLAAVKRALAEEKKQIASQPVKKIEAAASDGRFCRVCLKVGSVFSCSGCKQALYCSSGEEKRNKMYICVCVFLFLCIFFLFN